MNREIRTFLMAETFLFFAMGMLGPIYAVFVEGIGGDILTAGISWSVFSALSGAGFLVTGKLVDRMKSEKPFIIAGYGLQAVGFMGYLFVSEPIQLFIVQAILGISSALSYPSRESWFTKFLDKGKFGFQWATWEALYSFTVAIASLVGAAIATVYGFRSLFVAMVFVSLCGLVVSTRIPGARK